MLCAVLFILLPCLALGVLIISRDAWHMLDVSKIVDTEQSTRVFDSDGNEISCLFATENRIDIEIQTLPEYIKNAFIAAEDARFYTHRGFDIIRIFGAALNDLKAQAYVEGASTITQQLIKLSHLSSEKELTRKLDEAILAYQLEKIYDKDEILELYLNYVYFGNGCYGIEAAARTYFGVQAKDLSLAQAALLAGVLKAPTRYAPHLRPDASIGRRGVILELMAEYGFISEAEAKTAQAEPLVLAENVKNNRRGYYIDLALTQACELLDIEMIELLTGGYRIETMMDSNIQSICEAAFANDQYFPEYNGESAQGAIVIVDSSTGGVCALLGGRDNDIALAYNRAVEIRRQPGSAIKPILVYAPALENGYTAATMLLDEQTDFGDYTPKNASGRYSGWVTMREAVTKSLNIPAVSVFSELSPAVCKSFASRLGISFHSLDTRLALALGGFTYGVSPYQLAGAYAAISSGGVYNEPYVIASISDSEGNELYRHQSNAVRVMQKGNAFILTSMLTSVVESGTAQSLSALNIQLAAKTGTVGDSTGNRDIWLASYNPDYAAVIWMGYDDSSGGRQLPADSGGGTYPAEVMKEIFTNIYIGRVAPVFSVPDDVISVRLDKHTLSHSYQAVLASDLTPTESSVYEYFLKGTEPVIETSYWAVPKPPEDLRLQKTNEGVSLTFTPQSPYFEYRLYREDSSGYAVLLQTFTNNVMPCTYTDDTSGMSGVYYYYVVPSHPELTIDGIPVVGEASQRVSVWLYYLPYSFGT
ncbi:MAG: PBP1A family penicillin-binding protein [Clostridia bacterium]|nr:PBP1A family penicillin-binding protein [Clostridia bacterium]